MFCSGELVLVEQKTNNPTHIRISPLVGAWARERDELVTSFVDCVTANCKQNKHKNKINVHLDGSTQHPIDFHFFPRY